MDQKLHVFIKVAERKSFSRAAEELHMTQPAVSQYIRAFEEDIGSRLLERTNKSVYLNKAGDIVYHHGKEIIELYRRMEHLINDLTEQPKGLLKIGASYTFGEYVLPHILAQLRQEYPAIQPTITIGNTTRIAELVTAHQLDIGIVEGGLKDKDLKEVYIANDLMVIVLSTEHRLAKMKKEITIRDLNEELWIIREEGSGTREATEAMFKQSGIHPEECVIFSSTQSIKEAVGAGMGISLLSTWAIQKELKSGELQFVTVQGLPFRRQFSTITHSTFKTKALKLFMNMIQNNDFLTYFQKE